MFPLTVGDLLHPVWRAGSLSEVEQHCKELGQLARPSRRNSEFRILRALFDRGLIRVKCDKGAGALADTRGNTAESIAVRIDGALIDIQVPRDSIVFDGLIVPTGPNK